MKALLIGNPNCGKTAVFNRLTGAHRYVGNRAGVTVDKAVGTFAGSEIIDSPGVYSLIPYTSEERITKELLDKGGYDVIVNVIDATNLKRNLYLTLELAEQNRPLILAVNFMDRLKKSGTSLDLALLSARLGTPVLGVSAKTGEGIDALKGRITAPPPAPPARQGGNLHKRADEIASACLVSAPDDSERSEMIDRILLHPWLCYPVLISLLAGMLALVFGSVGQTLKSAVEWVVNDAAAVFLSEMMVRGNAPSWVQSLVLDALIGGVGGILSFLPQIALLFLCMSLLEDSGYMARTAFLTDAFLSRIGLSGRSFIPMLMGLGCTTPAVMGARTMQNDGDRRLTAILTPFVSCSAKLPVYVLMTSAFFPKNGGAVIILVYLIGIAVAALWGTILKKTVFRDTTSPFVMELPPYRLPRLRDTLLNVWERCRGFLVKAGTVIFAMNTLVWFFEHFDLTLSPVSDLSQSAVATLGKILAPLFLPLGFGFWQAAVALICGTVAKESAVSSLLVLFSVSEEALLSQVIATLFTPASALSFMVFVLLSPPCISALTTLKNEMESTKYMALSIVMQFFSAYIMSFLIYRLLS